MTCPTHSFELRRAHNCSYPDDSRSELPVVDQFDAVEAYRAFDDGALAEAPFALAAYVTHQRHFAL